MDTEKAATYKPGGEPAPETKHASTSILDFNLQNQERTRFCFLSHQPLAFC